MGEFRVPSFEFRVLSRSRSRVLRLAPRGLTLVELLVVIVILTTLVAGVVPVLSPNNDARKIDVAGRGLQSYITLIKSRAALTGRPQGIAFKESSPGSGVALEVLALEQPPAFAGFSTESRVLIEDISTAIANGNLPANSSEIYGPDATILGTQYRGNRGGDFLPRYNRFPLYNLRFLLADGTTLDPYPPRMFQIGDVIDVSGNQFLIVDDFEPTQLPNIIEAFNGVEYLASQQTVAQLNCVWINNSGQIAPRGLRSYKILRQPRNSSEAPYQLPAGVAIDFQGSVTEGNENIIARGPTPSSLFTRLLQRPNPTTDQDLVGVMFSPTGAVSQVLLNGNNLEQVSRLVLLLGRVENGGLDLDPATTPKAWQVANINDKNEIEEKQRDINWLNLDSRLISIATRNGRTTVSETAFVDPSLAINIGNNDGETAELQLEAAHAFAHEMSTAN